MERLEPGPFVMKMVSMGVGRGEGGGVPAFEVALWLFGDVRGEVEVGTRVCGVDVSGVVAPPVCVPAVNREHLLCAR